MQEQIHKELAILQNELSKLDSAVKHIQDAEKLAQSITSNGKELQAKYTEQLEDVKKLTSQYQKLVEESEKVIDKIDKVDFPNRLDKLDTAVTGINQGLQNTQLKLENLSRQISDEVKEINTEITGINKGIQNTQMKLENLSRQISDDIKEVKADYGLKMEAAKKEVNILRILLFIVIALCIGIIVLKFTM